MLDRDCPRIFKQYLVAAHAMYDLAAKRQPFARRFSTVFARSAYRLEAFPAAWNRSSLAAWIARRRRARSVDEQFSGRRAKGRRSPVPMRSTSKPSMSAIERNRLVDIVDDVPD